MAGRTGEIDARISEEIVRVYLDFHGRGPSRARTRRHEDLVICVLDDVFGPAEQTLVEAGHFERVRSNRLALHERIEPLLRATVEAATGAEVLACIGQVAANGLAVEVFLIASAPPPEPLA
jgi:uncharacterized protein YbcI